MCVLIHNNYVSDSTRILLADNYYYLYYWLIACAIVFNLKVFTFDVYNLFCI